MIVWLPEVDWMGNTQLSAAWTDPDSDHTKRAVFCAGALEIPIPRWTSYDAKLFAIDMPRERRCDSKTALRPCRFGTRRWGSVSLPHRIPR